VLDELIAVASKAIDEYDNGGDPEATRQSLYTVSRDTAFASAPINVRYLTYYYLFSAEAALGNKAEAYRNLRAAGEVAPQYHDATDWTNLAWFASYRKETEAYVDALIVLARQFPDRVAEWNTDGLIDDSVRAASNLAPNDGRKLALLEALWGMGYESSDLRKSEDWISFDLFARYVEEGNESVAWKVRSALLEPDSLAALSYDNRYREFAASNPFEAYEQALAAEIERWRVRAKERPRELYAAVLLALRLERANRLDEAMALLDELLVRGSAAPQMPPPYNDMENLQWAEYQRVSILRKQGRWDEALAGQIAARDAMAAKRNDTVSQNLNLAELYLTIGQPNEALNHVELVTRTNGISPYGLIVATWIEACARQQLGQEREAAEAVDYLREHAADDSDGNELELALLCRNDLDAVADARIQRLEDPATREATLERLQVYLPQPNATKFTADLNERDEAVSQREDVRAAVAKYGRILSWPSFGAL
jgi:tetratricopeptide (TPR) repeat protein